MNLRKTFPLFLPRSSSVWLLTFIILMGCGKYGPPVAPEIVAPSAVSDLLVAGTTQGVSFSWTAPEKDRRGTDLKDLEGYKIERKVITKPSDVVDDSVEFEIIAELEDSHIKTLQELRKAAREEGRITRKISVDSSLKKFSHVDTSVKPGVRYIYQVVPLNNGGTEGDRGKMIQVLYRGDTSEIRLFDENALDLPL